MELFKANRQWSTRPADERFESMKALYDATRAYADQAREKNIPYADLRVEPNNDEVQLVGKAGIPAQLTHWSFGQLCSRMEAPASYLRDLPPTLACQNLNHGLAKRGSSKDMASLMFHNNGSLLLRAITSEAYSRIWNWEVAERLLQLESMGWEPARPDIRVNLGDFPALYASDHDMFAFVRNRQVRIMEPGTTGLQRGIIVENSEVGASALKMTRFLYREMCGNHIIWGASKVLEINVRHVGDARERFSSYAYQLRRYAESSASDEEATIASAKSKILGQTKEEVLDMLFGKRALNLSRKVLEAGYDATIPHEDGSPRSVWGIVQGLTRHSQTIPYADQRNTVDKAAGRIMEFAF